MWAPSFGFFFSFYEITCVAYFLLLSIEVDGMIIHDIHDDGDKVISDKVSHMQHNNDN